MLRALDIFGLGFTSLVLSPKDGDDGGVACTAATTGNVAVTPRRLELLLGLLGVGVVDIIGEDCDDLWMFVHQTLVTHRATYAVPCSLYERPRRTVPAGRRYRALSLSLKTLEVRPVAVAADGCCERRPASCDSFRTRLFVTGDRGYRSSQTLWSSPCSFVAFALPKGHDRRRTARENTRETKENTEITHNHASSFRKR